MRADLEAIQAGLQQLGSVTIQAGDLCAEKHRYRPNPPLSEDEVRRFEVGHRVTLPPEYHAFLTQVGNGGAGPGYGLFKLGEVVIFWDSEPWRENDGLVGRLSEPFPHTRRWNGEDRPESEYFAPLNGAIPISDIGCGSRFWLVVTGPEAGNVWCDNRADHMGLSPMACKDASRAPFLNWYREWLDKEVGRLGGEARPP